MMSFFMYLNLNGQEVFLDVFYVTANLSRLMLAIVMVLQ